MKSELLRGSLTTDEAARYLEVSAVTLKRWRAIRTGPPYLRVGQRKIRYRVEDLDSWLREQMNGSPGLDASD